MDIRRGYATKRRACSYDGAPASRLITRLHMNDSVSPEMSALAGLARHRAVAPVSDRPDDGDVAGVSEHGQPVQGAVAQRLAGEEHQGAAGAPEQRQRQRRCPPTPAGRTAQPATHCRSGGWSPHEAHHRATGLRAGTRQRCRHLQQGSTVIRTEVRGLFHCRSILKYAAARMRSASFFAG